MAVHLAVLTLGNVAIGIQPARGYNIDPKAPYHDAHCAATATSLSFCAPPQLRPMR